MHLKAGTIIKSTAALNDTLFQHATILIAEYNKDGAMGFVVNRHFGRSLHELEEFKHSPSFPLYDGGPVDKEHLFFIHQRPDLIEASRLINNGIYYGGNFIQAVAAINNKSITTKDIKIFIGYCGWDKDELEAEIAEGSWVIPEEVAEPIFA